MVLTLKVFLKCPISYLDFPSSQSQLLCPMPLGKCSPPLFQNWKAENFQIGEGGRFWKGCFGVFLLPPIKKNTRRPTFWNSFGVLVVLCWLWNATPIDIVGNFSWPCFNLKTCMNERMKFRTSLPGQKVSVQKDN